MSEKSKKNNTSNQNIPINVGVLNSSSNLPAPHDATALADALRNEFHATLEERVYKQLSAIEESMKNKATLTTDNVDVEDINGRIASLRSYVYEIRDKFDAKIANLVAMNTKALDQCEQLDQDLRANTLLLHGVAEEPEEATLAPLDRAVDVAADLLGPDYNKRSFIDRAFRLGKPRSAAEIVSKGPRPILVKFVSHHIKTRVYWAKKKLKGTKVYITESLTPNRQSLLQRAKVKYGPRNAWSTNGRIYALVNNVKTKIDFVEDVNT